MTKYMKYTTKKLWGEYVSVRSDRVKKAMDEGKGLKIHYKSAVMTIEPEDIESRIVPAHNLKFKSKYENMKYELVQFIWSADIEAQPPLFFGDEYNYSDYYHKDGRRKNNG